MTEKLLMQMDEFVSGHDARLVVVFLLVPDPLKAHYQQFLQQNGITAIDCVYPSDETMRVKGEGHPNGAMNSKWASCILEGITRLRLLR